MWKIFKRKKESQPEAPPLPPCMHTWKDFPWYIKGIFNVNSYYGSSSADFYIYEPYVCAHCKERKDVVLLHSTRSGISRQRFNEILKEMQDEYKDYIKPTPIIEDMINDFIFIDKEKLNILENLRNAKVEKIKVED